MADTKTATSTPVKENEIKAELLPVEISAVSQDAFNFVFAYRNAAMIAVKGSAKVSDMREQYATEFFTDAVKKEALVLARRLYVKANNVAPNEVRNITERQLWSFIAGL